MDLTLILKHRSFIMGFAILFIAVFHTYLVGFLPLIGDTFFGVDIFFFLSAIGLYLSMSKSNNCKRYYTHRFLRIFPSYWPVVLIFCIVSGYTSFFQMASAFSTLGFWFGTCVYDWYVPAICSVYLLFPLWFRLIDRVDLLYAIIITAISSAIFFVVAWFCNNYWYNLLFTRIPVFLLGCVMCKAYLENKTIRLNNYIGLIVVIAYCFVYRYYGGSIEIGVLQKIFGFFIVPFLCIWLSLFTEKIQDTGIIANSFSYLGTISLELYLIHGGLFVRAEEIFNRLSQFLKIETIYEWGG